MPVIPRRPFTCDVITFKIGFKINHINQMVDSDLDADCGGKRCDNGLTDELDEEAEVEDPAEDLDDPREESESDSLGGRA